MIATIHVPYGRIDACFGLSDLLQVICTFGQALHTRPCQSGETGCSCAAAVLCQVIYVLIMTVLQCSMHIKQ